MNSASTSRRPSRPFQVAAPLLLGLALMALFLVLLFRQRAPESASEVAAPAPAVEDLRLPAPLKEIPKVAPTEKGPMPPRQAARGARRWKIEPLPEGWSVEIAEQLAELFRKIHFNPSDPDSFLEAGPAYEELDKYLKNLGPEALPTLAAILNAEPFYVCRRHLLLAIGGLGPQTEDATDVLVDFFNARRGDLQARSEMNYCIQAMGRLQNDTSLETLSRMIADGGNENYYRDKSIIALGDHPRREEKKTVFTDMMRSSQDFNVRNHAAQAIGKVATPDLLPDLMEGYEKEPHWVARQTILGSIGKIGDPSALPFLEEVARTASEDGVRLSAANAINKIAALHKNGSLEAKAILKDLAQTEPKAQVRAHILKWAEP
ncbi:MAG: HEAT repeat domain-containing protein [Planctomycetes bacterium]|nr:HEAT repeat domain-containing protein [Planctomycetota bacterium]